MRVPPLSGPALEAAVGQVNDWKLEGSALHREFRFASFESAFAFMAEAALHIVKLDHHPEWTNVYNRLSVTLSTHDSGGVTEKDIQLAKLLDSLAARAGSKP